MIPSEVNIYGQTIKTLIDNLRLSGDSLTGEADYLENVIRIASKWRNTDLSQCSIEQTYFHELVHMILTKSGWQDVLFSTKEAKEHFVENFSALLHQVLKTAKYEEIEKVS